MINGITKSLIITIGVSYALVHYIVWYAISTSDEEQAYIFRNNSTWRGEEHPLIRALIVELIINSAFGLIILLTILDYKFRYS